MGEAEQLDHIPQVHPLADDCSRCTRSGAPGLGKWAIGRCGPFLFLPSSSWAPRLPSCHVRHARAPGSGVDLAKRRTSATDPVSLPEVTPIAGSEGSAGRHDADPRRISSFGVDSALAVRGHGEWCIGHCRRTKGIAMSSVATFRHVTAEHASLWLTGTLARTTVSVGVVAAVVTTVGAVGLRAAGVPLAVDGRIPLAGFAQVTFVAAVIGGVFVALLNRRSSAPRRRFVEWTIGLTAISCVAPATFADTTVSRVALVGLHLVCLLYTSRCV